VPFAFISYGLIHKGHQVALILGSIIIMAGAVRSWPLRVFGAYAAGWFLFLRIGDMAHLVDPLQAIRAMNATIYMIVAYGIYLSVSCSNSKKEYFFNAICVLAILQSIIGFCQFFNTDPILWLVRKITTIDHPLDDVVSGTLGNPNFIGGFLGISLPFFFRKKWVWLSILPVFHLLTLHSSGAMAAALIAVVVYFKQWKILIAMAVIGIIFVALLEDMNVFTNPRWGWWLDILKKICATPKTFLIGYGPGAPTGYKFPVHNEWLEMWFNYGAVSIVMAGIYIKNIYRGDKILLAGFAAFITNSLANYGWHLAPSGFLILIIMGLLEREKYGGLSNTCKPYYGNTASG